MKVRLGFVGTTTIVLAAGFGACSSDPPPGSVSPSVVDGGTDAAHDAEPTATRDAEAESDADAGPRPTAIFAGGRMTCARIGTTLECWGSNDDQAHPTPSAVPGVTVEGNLASIGFGHACAGTAGQISCWGDNELGALGHAPGAALEANPAVVSGLVNVAGLRLGYAHSCAVLADKSVTCFGDNRGGALGFLTPDAGPYCQERPCNPTPTAVPNVHDAVEVAAGLSSTCIRRDPGGTVQCWGSNVTGNLGQASTGADGAPHPTPLDVPGISGATAIASGFGHVCAILADKTVSCWGDNSLGQLGHSAALDDACGDFGAPCRSTPMTVAGLSDIREISLGELHSCALDAAGSVFCWGWNGLGQLGREAPSDTTGTGLRFTTTPLLVEYLDRVEHIAAGMDHTCALTSAGNIECWGDNSAGQLGSTLGRATYASVPTRVGSTR